jgi:hypothetical protein
MANRNYKDIGKRAKNSINAHLQKLISKYGHDDVRLVCNKFFEQRREKARILAEIAKKEKELAELNKRK